MLTRTRRTIEAIGVIAVVAMTAGTMYTLYRLILGHHGVTLRLASAHRPPVRDSDIPGMHTAIEVDRLWGSSQARLVLLEFTDFQCPFCARYARETFGRIRDEFVRTGRVAYSLRHYPLEKIHHQSLRAAEAQECTAGDGEGSSTAMHDWLFANAHALTVDGLKVHATSLGLDASVFARCLAGTMVPRIRADVAEGQRLGVTGTPTFFLGQLSADGTVVLRRRFEGAVSYPEMKAAIETALHSGQEN